jgi:hypothetical protein
MLQVALGIVTRRSPDRSPPTSPRMMVGDDVVTIPGPIVTAATHKQHSSSSHLMTMVVMMVTVWEGKPASPQLAPICLVR